MPSLKASYAVLTTPTLTLYHNYYSLVLAPLVRAILFQFNEGSWDEGIINYTVL